MKAVNEREDNAQSHNEPTANEEAPPNAANRTEAPHENERLEAADDNNEVHPRSPKVN